MNSKLSLFAALCCLSLPVTAHAFELQLQLDSPKDPSASLFGAPREFPTAMKVAVASEVADALSSSAEAFLRDLDRGREVPGEALAGGGDAQPDINALLAGLLGFFPGFGLGHFLIAGDSAGGMKWLIIDVIFVVVIIFLDFLFFGPLYPLFFLGELADLAWFVVHIFQGIDAYHAAGGGGGRRLTEAPREMPIARREDGEVSTDPLHAFPNVLALHF